ncbi:MAG: hypothetical protein QOI57_2332 [Rubrobacteraceae bacterium]|jgi:hypothetical protein|nr:hypothetical protein [Rubrobacteraceae bacterium]
MELQNKEQLKVEILQSWLKSAWVYPMEGPGNQTFLRLTPGGRLKMRRRIGELETSLGVKGRDVSKQEEAGTLPVERDTLELAMMVQAYTSERRFMESQGAPLGTAAVTLEDDASEESEETNEISG